MEGHITREGGKTSWLLLRVLLDHTLEITNVTLFAKEESKRTSRWFMSDFR
jgi:hypothetical protein